MDNNQPFLEGLNATIAKNFDTYEYMFQNSFGWNLLDAIRYEICVCILTESNQAVITLTNHLLEKALKVFLFHLEPSPKGLTDAKDIEEHFKNMNLKYGSKDLNDTINLCCSKGLISKEQKEQLHTFRNDFRNAFGHAEPNKIFGKAETKVIVFNPLIHKEVPKPVMVKNADFPFIHDHKQEEIADQKAIPYFEYVDKVIKEVLPKLFNMPKQK